MGLQHAQTRQPQGHVPRGWQHQPGILSANHGTCAIRHGPTSPRTQVIVQEDKKWGDKERDLLYKVGLQNSSCCTSPQFVTVFHRAWSSLALANGAKSVTPSSLSGTRRPCASKLHGSWAAKAWHATSAGRGTGTQLLPVYLCTSTHVHKACTACDDYMMMQPPWYLHNMLSQGGCGQGAGCQQGHRGRDRLLEGRRARGGQRRQRGQVPCTAIGRRITNKQLAG